MNKKKKTMIETLREIRNRIGLETMDMNFEQLQQYFYARRAGTDKKNRKGTYKTKSSPSLAAEPHTKYSK